MTGFLFAAQQASATSYHLQHTLSVMTAVGRIRQVWVTPSPVTPETRGTDVTDFDRSSTSNCCNHLTHHTPPPPCLPRSPRSQRRWGAFVHGVVLQPSSPLRWRVSMNGCSKHDPWEFSLYTVIHPLPLHQPPSFFAFSFDSFHISPSESSVGLGLLVSEASRNYSRLYTLDYASTSPGMMPL